MSLFQFRPEQPGDQAAIRRVHEAAFGQPDEAALVDALRAAGDLVPDLCLVAERGSTACIEGASPNGGGGARQRCTRAVSGVLCGVDGVYRRERCIAGRNGSPCSVDALRTRSPQCKPCYPRFGFERAAALGVRAPFDVPDENWMALRLPAYGAGVRYAAAFGAVT